MKRSLLLLLTAITILSACKKDGIAKKDEFQDSYKKFTDFKASVSNSYIYVVATGSVFGSSSSTTLTVKNGKVVARSYQHYRRDGNGPNVLVTSWDEDGSSIATHNEGAEPLTLDQVYDKAKNEWLKADTKTNKIYFETDANGLLASCGYVPDGCQDDCFRGITITSIKAFAQIVLF